MTTAVYVNTTAYAATHVATNMLGSIRSIIKGSGLSPDLIRDQWATLKHGIATWLASRHLKAVTLEIYDPGKRPDDRAGRSTSPSITATTPAVTATCGSTRTPSPTPSARTAHIPGGASTGSSSTAPPATLRSPAGRPPPTGPRKGSPATPWAPRSAAAASAPACPTTQGAADDHGERRVLEVPRQPGNH